LDNYNSLKAYLENMESFNLMQPVKMKDDSFYKSMLTSEARKKYV
jgi:hypothetical protein